MNQFCKIKHMLPNKIRKTLKKFKPHLRLTNSNTSPSLAYPEVHDIRRQTTSGNQCEPKAMKSWKKFQKNSFSYRSRHDHQRLRRLFLQLIQTRLPVGRRALGRWSRLRQFKGLIRFRLQADIATGAIAATCDANAAIYAAIRHGHYSNQISHDLQTMIDVAWRNQKWNNECLGPQNFWGGQNLLWRLHVWPVLISKGE